MAQLRRFTLDKLSEAAFGLVQDLTRDFIHKAVSTRSQGERDAIRRLLDALIHDLRGVSPPEPLEVVSRCADILFSLAPDREDEWRQPLTIAWVAAAAVSSLRFSIGGAQGSASVSLVGLGTNPIAQGQILKLPDPTGVIASELDAFFNPRPPQFELTHAIAYLTGTGAEALYLRIPGLHEAIDPLLAPLGLTGAELLHAALEAGFSTNIASTTLYTQLRDFLKNGVDNEIETRLIPALRAAAPANRDSEIWLDEAAEPSLLLLSAFVFDRLDTLVAGKVARSDVSPFMESFRSALSAVVSQIVVRNVVVVADVLREHAYQGLSQSFHALSVAAESPNHPVAQAAGELVRALVPQSIPLPSNYKAISARLASDVFEAASAGFDPSVFSDARRARLRQLEVDVLLSIDGSVDYKDAVGVEGFFRQAAECLYVPAPDKLQELVLLQTQLLAEQGALMFPKIAQALQRFFLDISAPALDDLDRAARALLDWLLKDIQDALAWLQELNDRLTQIAADIRRFTQDVEDHLGEARDVLKSSSRRSDIFDDVADLGAAEARRVASHAFGFDLLPPAQQQDAQNAAEATFRAAFSLVRPVLNEALKVLGAIAGDLTQLIDGAQHLDDALSALGREVVDKVDAEVRRQLGIFGVALPSEISPATMAQAARDALKQLPPLRTAIQALLDAKHNVASAQSRQQTTQNQRANARTEYDAAVARRQQELGGTLEVDILSPLPVAPGNNWAYRHDVLLRLRIKGARLSFVEAGAKRRVRLVLNSGLLNPPPRDWSQNSDGIVLTTTLTAGQLKRGMNSIECSVTNGRGTIKRATCLFVFQPLDVLTSPIAVDARASHFGAQLDQGERLVLVNNGRATVTLTGWRVLNENRDVFTLPTARLLHGESIALESGPQRPVLSGPIARPNTPGRPSAPAPSPPPQPATHTLTWSRSPVWRDAGDTVVLVDPQGVMRLAYSFGDRA
jgi:hypothetical protein